MLKPRKRYVALGVVAILVAGTLAHRALLPYALKWLDIGEVPQKSQAVFVLFGNNDTRPFVAAALYNAGLADEILMAVCSTSGLNRQSRPNHQIYKHILVSRGVPEDRIRILGNSSITNTMNESAVLREYLEHNPKANVTVVTSHYHTRRTRWSLQRNLGEHANRLRYVSAPHDDFDANDWWVFPIGFQLVVLEYIKLMGYWVFYGAAVWYFLGTVVAVAAFMLYRRAFKPPASSVAALETS